MPRQMPEDFRGRYIVHADRNAQDGGQRQLSAPICPGTQGAMVGAPVAITELHITEGPLSGEIGHKVMCGQVGSVRSLICW